MRSRTQVPVAAVALALLVSSCGWFGGGGDTTTSTTEDTSTTTTTTDRQAELEAEPESLLQGDIAPPSGVEAQLGLTISPMTNCPRLLNGPGPIDDDAPFEHSPATLARLMFGDLLYERITLRVETDPTLADRIAALTPVFEVSDLAAILDPPPTRGTILPQTGLTFPPRNLPSITVLPTIAPPPLALIPVITLPPAVTTPPIDVAPPATTPEIEQTSDICVSGAGWTANSFLNVTIVDSEGTAVVDRFEPASDEGNFSLWWSAGLEDQVGRYTVTLSDGNFTAETNIDVVAPTRPTIDVLGAEVIEPGDVLRIGFVGFPPQSTAVVSIFAENELTGWRYTGTADGIAINGVGSAEFELQTLEDDPPGVYCVLLDGAPQWTCTNVQFDVTG